MRELVKKLIPERVFKFIEPYGHKGEAMLMNAVAGFPARGLKVIGVTGTDGKTTTSTLIYTMLKEAGYKAGLMTTISIGGDHLVPNATRMTVITSHDLVTNIKRMRREGVGWLVLETTSHALAQGRVWGIPYSIAVMTNVNHEHLDYHGTFENYRDAKLKLFQLTAKNEDGLQTGIVNLDDPSGELFAAAVPKAISYGRDRGDLQPSHIKVSPEGSDYRVSYQERKLKIHTNLPGTFNIYNSLAAVGVGIAVGLNDEQIERGIAALESVEGRMNPIDEGQKFSVIVDYAHTPDSFEKIFAEVKPLTSGRLIVVFGSAGRRDKAKRALQGKAAGEWCELVVVTEEDDRDEDGIAIMKEIAGGAEEAGRVRKKDLFEIHDRAEAVEFAINQAKAGDTVLLLGKGHERSILSNGGKRPWNEVATARSAIQARQKREKA